MTFPYGPYAGPLSMLREMGDANDPYYIEDAKCWEWLKRNVGEVRYDFVQHDALGYPCLWFETEEDAVLYHLKWSGKLWDSNPALRDMVGLIG